MDTRRIEQYQEDIIAIGKEAYRKGLVVGWGGNMSVRLDGEAFLITTHRAALGFLTRRDFLIRDLKGNTLRGEGTPSTETGLHTAIYQCTDARAVVHLHPPYTNVLAVSGVQLKAMTFESALSLGATVPVVAQESPSVTRLEEVTGALQLSNVVILKGHGTVAVGEDLQEAFFLSEILEESAMMTYVRSTLEGPAAGEKRSEPPVRGKGVEKSQVFSTGHIERVVQLVNQDEEAQRLGRSTHLTVRYAIKLAETGQVYNFHFEEGTITKVTNDEDADFIITGKREQWVAVLNGVIDPFAATTQKKLKLQKGNVGDLSKWYPPFYRIFKLWEQVPVE